MMQEETPQN